MKTEKYYSCRDIASMTGKSIRAVWVWCSSGKLRASRPGGRNYVITETDFKKFMSSGIPQKTTKAKND
jgi:transposase